MTKRDQAIPLFLSEDTSAADHGFAVADHCARIATAMGLSKQRVARLRLAGALHDIGKTMIPEEVLETPGPLNGEQWTMVRLHPVLGEQVLMGEGLLDLAPWVRSHHERYDGFGYPDRLRAAEIPIEARILAVADAYDAMVSDRPYSAPKPPAEAREELALGSGSQFDPQVVATFLRCLARPAPSGPVSLVA